MLRSSRLDFRKAREIVTPQDPSYAAAIKAAELARNVVASSASSSSQSSLDASNMIRLGWQKNVFKKSELNNNASATDIATGQTSTTSPAGSSAVSVSVNSQTLDYQALQTNSSAGPNSCASQQDCTDDRLCLNGECVCPVKGSTTCPVSVSHLLLVFALFLPRANAACYGAGASTVASIPAWMVCRQAPHRNPVGEKAPRPRRLVAVRRRRQRKA